MNEPKYCDECGDELADDEEGLCDNCLYQSEEDDDFEEEDE